MDRIHSIRFFCWSFAFVGNFFSSVYLHVYLPETTYGTAGCTPFTRRCMTNAFPNNAAVAFLWG